MSKPWIKTYEFWHPRVFEFPFYCYLALQCLLNRISIRSLAKANYALYHGEIGIGSKFESQLQFPSKYFMPTDLLPAHLDCNEKAARIEAFGAQYGYPLILKPDTGLVGKGIVKIDTPEKITRWQNQLIGPYIIQQFTHKTYECGIFFCRESGVPEITGINKKHFPAITGNGIDSIKVLAQREPRFTHHWQSFLQYIDTERIPEKGERVTLSFIGSHTLGCMFTDDSHLLTDELERAVFKLFENQPGFNFGRIDVKADNQESLQRGEFVVIEVNGISSLPTHMFDPDNSLLTAYKIFFQHGKRLVKIAKEQQKRPMALLSHREILRKVIDSQTRLDQVHRALKGS